MNNRFNLELIITFTQTIVKFIYLIRNIIITMVNKKWIGVICVILITLGNGLIAYSTTNSMRTLGWALNGVIVGGLIGLIGN